MRYQHLLIFGGQKALVTCFVIPGILVITALCIATSNVQGQYSIIESALQLLAYGILVITALCIATSNVQGQYSIIESALQMLAYGINEDIREPRDERTIRAEYDFIIVGAGTAGCTLANRLTEISDWKVLLIEAGNNENFIMDVPIVANFLQFTDANWSYKTVPSTKACLGLDKRQCNYPRGKVMGGSSVLNYMIYTRGNRRDYDNWLHMGNPGWGWQDVLPYFKKSEDMREPEMANDKEYHNKGGYLTVTYPPFRTPLAEAFLQAGVETGNPIVDYNGKTQTGFSYLQSTLRNGTRWSASRAFLRPISNRKNLHVKKRSMVTKILIDPATKTAYGVKFQRNNRNYEVRAKREVIISGGSINSPQLLMLSGIGPRKHLRDLKIPVMKDLKVGYNLMDHVSAGGVIFLVNESVSLRTDTLLQDRANYVDYMSYHRGPWSVPGGCEALAFLDLKNPNATDGYPDIELLFLGGSIVSEPTYKYNFGIEDKLYDEVFEPILDQHTWEILPMLLRPKSKGRIFLQSSNPYDKPLIYHNYYAHPDDLATMVGGIKRAVELSKTKAFQRFDSRLHDTPLPGCKQLVFASDEYWGCLARHLSFTIYHLSGTCKMGPATDRTSVVDARLRVHGIKNLRVIDASIMPAIPAAHTNAPVYMIAEKGADMIKEDFGVLKRT